MRKKQNLDPYIKDLTGQIISLREKIRELKKKIVEHKKPKTNDSVSLTITFD